MTHHEWGSTWFKIYGQDLNEAMHYIRKYVFRRTLCHVVMKEKYGTIRYEFIYAVSWATYLYSYKRTSRIFEKAVRKAVYRWPWLADELLEDYDGTSLSTPSEFAYKIRRKYWTQNGEEPLDEECPF